MALKSVLLKYDIPKETLACLFWFYSFAFRGRVCIAQANPEITVTQAGLSLMEFLLSQPHKG